MVFLASLRNDTSAGRPLREEEDEGYLDNLVVRRVSRQSWLAGELVLVLAVIVAAAVLGGMVFWIAAALSTPGRAPDSWRRQA